MVKLDLIIKITTPVRYSTICKWELRSQDGRVAQSVPNGLCPHVIGFYFWTWHIPSRTDGVSPRSVMDVVIQKAENPSQQPTHVKKNCKVSGVSCTVYKPF